MQTFILVDQISHFIDQLNDRLGKVVAWSSLGTEDKDAWHHILIRIVLEVPVELDDMKQVKQLTLVGVETFHLHIKDGFCRNFCSC